MTDERRCLWHRCNREFEPGDRRQLFCSTDCRSARAKWKEKRGATIVDLLLEWDTKDLLRRRAEIEAEIEADTPKN